MHKNCIDMMNFLLYNRYVTNSKGAFLCMRYPQIVKKMSLEQKAAFVSGYDYWHLEEAPELGLPKIMITDGPHGLRKAKGKDYVPAEGEEKKGGIGLGNSVPATCFPPAATSSCSWDEDLLKQEGEAMGQECLKEKVSTILGPGTNIKRAPVCGRNFEYFSEDPLLTGKMAAAYVKGIQASGGSACPKHFACNNQESFRTVNNSIVSQRALREIYLKGFEICVKEAKPLNIMTSYNKINGVWSHYNYDLVTTVLRKEWGFDGSVMTDWWMQHSQSHEFPNLRDNAYRVRSQVDVYMPGSFKKTEKKYKPDKSLLETVGLKNGLTRGELERSAINVLNMILKLKY
jgi:beta-glucosidase-like glycosyl hydrolase